MINKMLSMRTTPFKLSMQTVNARQEIKSNHNVLSLKTEQPRLEMHTTQPKVMIDQSQCFAESGSKTIMQLIAENASYSRSMAIQGIGRIVDQGNQMANFHVKSDPIPDQADYNAYGQFEKAFNMQTATGTLPKTTLIRGKVDIRFIAGRVINNTVAQKPQITYQPGKVNINVAQYNRLEISVIDIKG